jgi:hypothetical protein
MIDNINIERFRLPGLTIGYHGCDEAIARKILLGEERLTDSTNAYDWLGSGQYFWEFSEERAWEWAQRFDRPYVVGAVINMGYCLNLMDTLSISFVKETYYLLGREMENTGGLLPVNRNALGNHDLLLRNLDCAVINYLHEHAEAQYNISFDTVRGLFPEGKPLYPDAGFRDKTHVQICVRNPACILGYFRPMHY